MPSAPARFFRVRNFERFQHYTDRRPPWIKLYRDLWDDPRFHDLSVAHRYMLIALFVVASQHENLVPFNDKWLRSKLMVNQAIPLQLFIDTGWLELAEQDASKALAAGEMLAERYPSRARAVYPNKETETDIDISARLHVAPEPEREAESDEKLPFGEFGMARMTKAEHGRLITRLNGLSERYIERFDRWVKEAPDAKHAGVKRKDRNAYASILAWYDRDLKEGRIVIPKSNGGIVV